MSCCSQLPPVQAEYSPKGSYTTIDGLKAYVIGPEDAMVSVLVVYDIFGYSPQILQGADLIASQGYRVVMPDFLVGNYATPEMFKPGNEAKKAEYFSKFPGACGTQSEPVAKAINSLKEAGHNKVAVAGYCWGYKAAVLSEGLAKADALISVHPTFPAPDDVDRINVPLAMLSSSGEDMNVINAIIKGVESKNPGKNFFKHFPEQVHGFAAARGDLSGGATTEAYAEAYRLIVKFLKDQVSA
ncbi:hypothetical protein J010_07070 [Cryptococcus neoformans]|nr:hypothetical protein C355_07056 [Cryptococcus neoformans var. grubii Th84]OXG99967.1 hypothetical protein J010_07070 [Cryptococcus neoformans var. grubii]OXH20848.1 hypothetical protein J009_07061 [Cryptococcus neoformans var. grubii]OXH40649.1 hypothetical protein J004_07111 [Cryptococcus neoformans var. grubii]OXH41784.1 hypothetical protein J003_07063 [Cryptococcus neoformans var. grubii]